MIKMKLNQKQTSKQIAKQEVTATVNHENGLSYTMSDRLKLYSQVATWMVGEPKFYSNDSDQENQDPEILQLIRNFAENDPEFLMKLAIYCRNSLYLRTAPTVLLVETALAKNDFSVRSVTPKIIKRPDELTSAVAYLQSQMGHIGNKSEKGSMPCGLKRGLNDAIGKFNTYSLAKYDNQRNQVKLRDVFRLVHPKPDSDEKNKIYNKIVNGGSFEKHDLKAPETWENIISKEGSNKDSWTKASKVMPIMATIRNLRNMLTNKIDMEIPINKLTDKEIILKSKQFPFRFLSAYRQVEKFTESMDTTKVLDALETSMNLSIENIPKLKGTTFLSADNSNSMTNTISERSSVQYADIANLLQSISSRMCDSSLTSIFATQFEVVHMPKSNGIISNINKIKEIEIGYATNGYLTIDYLIKNNIKVDRIILFTDEQMYDTSGYDNSLSAKLIDYRSKINHDAYCYIIDLAGYGTLQVPESDPKTCLIAGWSDKILNYIPLFEAEKKTAIDEIDSINL